MAFGHYIRRERERRGKQTWLVASAEVCASARWPFPLFDEEKFLGVPERGGRRDLISTDPLSPGTVYAAGLPQTVANPLIGVFAI
jgi:hypothetical protein